VAEFKGVSNQWHYLMPPLQKLRHASVTALGHPWPSRYLYFLYVKLASRIGLSAMVFQTLDSAFRRNDDVIRGFCLKVVPLGPVTFSPGKGYYPL